MNASRILERQVLNHFFRNLPQTPPTQLFVALYIDDPTDNDIGTEINGGAYQRQQITFTAPTDFGGGSQIANTVEIRFPIAVGDWGEISHFGIRDAATGGTLMAHGVVAVPKKIENGDEAMFRAGLLTVHIG